MKIEDYFEVIRLPDFDKEMKKMTKKYRTLENDLNRFLMAQVYMYHIEKQNVKGLYRIQDLGIKDPKIYKATRFSCQALKGGGSYSGIRVIYAYIERKNSKDKIMLIEIYYKGVKENEDRYRIHKYFG